MMSLHTKLDENKKEKDKKNLKKYRKDIK